MPLSSGNVFVEWLPEPDRLIGEAVGTGVGTGVAVGVGVSVANAVGVGVAFCEPVQPQTRIMIANKPKIPRYLIQYLKQLTIIEGIYTAWDTRDRHIPEYHSDIRFSSPRYYAEELYANLIIPVTGTGSYQTACVSYATIDDSII